MTMFKLDCSDGSAAVAADLVRKGKIVVYPTDTVYGIGCDPYDDAAVEKVFRIKGRREGRQLPLLCSSLKHVNRIASLNETGKKLARLWPGPLTLIAELVDNRISSKVTVGTCTVGVRIPDSKCALSLIDKCGGVLVGTSANRSGNNTATDAKEVLEMLDGFDVLLDGGKSTLGIESTVIDVTKEKVNMIREGYIKYEQIERVLGNV